MNNRIQSARFQDNTFGYILIHFVTKLQLAITQMYQARYHGYYYAKLFNLKTFTKSLGIKWSSSNFFIAYFFKLRQHKRFTRDPSTKSELHKKSSFVTLGLEFPPCLCLRFSKNTWRIHLSHSETVCVWISFLWGWQDYRTQE